ncbi:hypothetical protein HAX54_006375 [Datura stramonium]|uniref:Uncharacterized protein n=1 Tax=Datura stramonium TaxID=4076 RepID=A0ABS8WYP3_DATST|nr:hypothetical protein [Datura stramonium]
MDEIDEELDLGAFSAPKSVNGDKGEKRVAEVVDEETSKKRSRNEKKEHKCAAAASLESHDEHMSELQERVRGAKSSADVRIEFAAPDITPLSSPVVIVVEGSMPPHLPRQDDKSS